METACPAEPRILTLWPFSKKAWWPCPLWLSSIMWWLLVHITFLFGFNWKSLTWMATHPGRSSGLGPRPQEASEWRFSQPWHWWAIAHFRPAERPGSLAHPESCPLCPTLPVCFAFVLCSHLSFPAPLRNWSLVFPWSLHPPLLCPTFCAKSQWTKTKACSHTAWLFGLVSWHSSGLPSCLLCGQGQDPPSVIIRLTRAGYRLLQRLEPLSHLGSRSVTQSCLTHGDPLDCSPPGSPVHGILQERIVEWVAISFSRDLPDPGTEPVSYVGSVGRQILDRWCHLGSPFSHLSSPKSGWTVAFCVWGSCCFESLCINIWGCVLIFIREGPGKGSGNEGRGRHGRR